MRRKALVLVTVTWGLAFSFSACSLQRFPGDSPPTVAPVPREIRFVWRGFKVELEPTVVLWGRDAHLDVPRIVRAALAKVDRALKGSPASIRVQAGSYRVIPDVGIGGLTDPSSGDVEISMDQRSPVPLERMLQTWLPLALAHELHHSKRILDGPGYGTTLLGALVTEGSAEAFVREMYPDAPAIPWVRALDPAQEADVWRRARKELDSPDVGPRHEAWFYGRSGLPRWAGYKIGYAIARAYLRRHDERSAADLASLPAREVLAGSGYDPRPTESDNG